MKLMFHGMCRPAVGPADVNYRLWFRHILFQAHAVGLCMQMLNPPLSAQCELFVHFVPAFFEVRIFACGDCIRHIVLLKYCNSPSFLQVLDSSQRTSFPTACKEFVSLTCCQSLDQTATQTLRWSQGLNSHWWRVPLSGSTPSSF